MIYKKYVETNNKFLTAYDPNKPTSYIIYLHNNNLYGQFMMQIATTEVIKLD